MKSWLRLTLITMTIGGGFSGVAQTIWMLADPANQQPRYMVIITAFLTLYAFVTLSGLLFVQNEQRTFPLRLALLLQVPSVSSPVIAYQFISGFHVTVSLVTSYFNVDFWLGSNWQFYLFSELPWGLGLNVFALFLLALSMRPMKTSNRTVADTTTVSGLPYTFIEEIDQIVQRRLTKSSMHDRSVHLYGQDNGRVAIAVNNVYQDVSGIEDAAIRDLIQASINEWQNGSK